MDINTLHSNIVQKNVQNFYIFTGTEIEVQNIYIKKIAECAHMPIRRRYDVASVVSSLRQRSMLETAACYVVRDDDVFLKEEKAWSTVVGMLGANILILLYTKLDNRSSFSKHFKDTICEFTALPTETLKKYIRKKLDLSDKDAEILAEICEFDYSRILLECDKIQRYADSVGVSASNALWSLIIDNTIHIPARDEVFKFVDCVLEDKREQAWDALYDAKEYGSATLQIISLLYNNTKQTLQVQSYEGSNIERATGLSAYQIKCARKHTNKFSNADLIMLMKLLHEAEKGIKTGVIGDDLALEYVLTKFFY